MEDSKKSSPPSGFGTGSKGRARTKAATSPAIAKKDEVKPAKVLDSKQAAGNTKTMKKGGNVKKMAVGGLPSFRDITKGPSGPISSVKGSKPAAGGIKAKTVDKEPAKAPAPAPSKTQTSSKAGALSGNSRTGMGGKGDRSPEAISSKLPTGGKGSASTKGSKLASKKNGGAVKKMAKGGRVKKMALGGVGAAMASQAANQSAAKMPQGTQGRAGGPKGGRAPAPAAPRGGKGGAKPGAGAGMAQQAQAKSQLGKLSETMRGQQTPAPGKQVPQVPAKQVSPATQPPAKPVAGPRGGKGGAQPKAPAPAPRGGKGGAKRPGMKKGGAVKKMAKGGSASSRGDGIAVRGKTKGKVC